MSAPPPFWSRHPVDVMKDIWERAGVKMDPDAEQRMRAICDEPVPVETWRLGARMIDKKVNRNA